MLSRASCLSTISDREEGPALSDHAARCEPLIASWARQVSEDPLDNPRFLCNIPEALARLLAANIDLDLNTYLLYA